MPAQGRARVRWRCRRKRTADQQYIVYGPQARAKLRRGPEVFIEIASSPVGSVAASPVFVLRTTLSRQQPFELSVLNAIDLKSRSSLKLKHPRQRINESIFVFYAFFCGESTAGAARRRRRQLSFDPVLDPERSRRELVEGPVASCQLGVLPNIIVITVE